MKTTEEKHDIYGIILFHQSDFSVTYFYTRFFKKYYLLPYNKKIIKKNIYIKTNKDLKRLVYDEGQLLATGFSF